MSLNIHLDDFRVDTNRRTGDTTLIAVCHGSKQEVVITGAELARMRSIRSILAFVEEAAERTRPKPSAPGRPA